MQESLGLVCLLGRNIYMQLLGGKAGISTHVYAHTHIYTCMYVYVYVCVYTHTRVCVICITGRTVTLIWLSQDWEANSINVS